MTKEIRLIDFHTEPNVDKESFEDAVVQALKAQDLTHDYINLIEIDVTNLSAESFNHIAKDLAARLKLMGADNVIFVPAGMIKLNKIEIIHTS